MKRHLPLDRLWIPLCCLVLTLCIGAPRLWAASEPPLQKTSAFTATLTRFQTSLGNSLHPAKVVTATIRFQNTTQKPLILGYVHNSGYVADDQGNRYLMGRDVSARGMGEINGVKVSPQFILQPGESAETMLDFYWLPGRNDIFGTKYTLDFTVRGITSINGSQYRLGPESPLEFSGLADGTWTGDSALTPAASPTASPPLTGANVNTQGPLSAQLVQLRTSKSKSGNNPKHVLTATVQFKNTSSAPIILAYEAGSGFFIDNLGNRYDHDAETGHTATGIGTITAGSADPQFVLEPGETRKAQFQLWRYIVRRNAEIGDHDTFYLAVKQLEILPSKQIRETRQYSLTFPDLTPDNAGGAVGEDSPPPAKADANTALLQGLVDAVRRKRK